MSALPIRLAWVSRAAVVLVFCVFPASVAAQHQHEMPPAEKSQPAMEHGASGTSLEPRSTPHAMLEWRVNSWSLLLHGSAFLIGTQQSGRQGADKVFSANWVMLSLARPAGKGYFTLRTMLSLEPATVTGRRYPLLFQTGETAFGQPLINGQHPHDFLMEVAAQYSLPLGEHTTLLFYAAPIGDPALGPVAFPHRTSAAEIPEAPLSHHLQDSTHIAASVFTVGLDRRWWRLEASTFHGREPNEFRWQPDLGAPDSFAARLTLRPADNWAVEVSHGRLNEPEELEAGDTDRTTAALTYNRPLTRGNWAASLIWGRNHQRPGGLVLNGFLAESSLRFRDRNYLFTRLENVDREGLFLTGTPEAEPLERVAAFTGGAARDLLVRDAFRLAAGFDLSFYKIPAVLEPLYGQHPVGARFFLRFRLGKSAGAAHQH
ncbi:MAG: hypothetical protein ACRD35_04325 [Candidatus Acidiferrales bacterium]